MPSASAWCAVRFTGSRLRPFCSVMPPKLMRTLLSGGSGTGSDSDENGSHGSAVTKKSCAASAPSVSEAARLARSVSACA